jgi:uncharacterized RDD family membrane protein YckC
MIRRALAFAIDALLFVFGLSLFSAMTGWADVDAGSGTARSGEYLVDFGVDFRFDSPADMVLVLLAFLIYKSGPESIVGMTIGKRLLGLRVIADSSRTTIGWKQAIVRNLTLIPSGFLLFLPTLLTIVVSDQRKRLGDSLARTLVVRTELNPANTALQSAHPGIGASQDAERPVGSLTSESQASAWYRTQRSQAVIAMVATIVLVWAGVRTDVISFSKGVASDPLQPGEVFHENFDEAFPPEGGTVGSTFWSAGTEVIETTIPGLMNTHQFNISDSNEALKLSLLAKRFEGENGIASLLWGLEKDTERYVAVFVSWSGGEISCGVFSSQSSESPVIHQMEPTNDCGDPSSGWHRLEIESNGSNFAFLVNGVQILGNALGDTPRSIGLAAELSISDGVTFAAQFDDLVLAEREADVANRRLRS